LFFIVPSLSLRGTEGEVSATPIGRVVNCGFLVEGELMVLSITSAGQELALQEQGETIRGLERTVEAERHALEVEKKQVEGEPLFDSCVVGFSLRVRTLFLTSFPSGIFRLAHRAWARC
jgi:hypothetical protein